MILQPCMHHPTATLDRLLTDLQQYLNLLPLCLLPHMNPLRLHLDHPHPGSDLVHASHLRRHRNHQHDTHSNRCGRLNTCLHCVRKNQKMEATMGFLVHIQQSKERPNLAKTHWCMSHQDTSLVMNRLLFLKTRQGKNGLDSDDPSLQAALPLSKRNSWKMEYSR